MRNATLQLLPTLLMCAPAQSSLQSWWSFRLVTVIIHWCMLNYNIDLVQLVKLHLMLLASLTQWAGLTLLRVDCHHQQHHQQMVVILVGVQGPMDSPINFQIGPF